MTKIEKYVNDEFKDRTTISVKISIPKTIWEEWNLDCIENFNDTRWLKLKFDHDFRKSIAPITALVIKDLDEVKESITEMKKSSDNGSEELESVYINPLTGDRFEK